MDLEVEIKEEPVWLEETDNISLEKFEFVSEMKPVKQETKSELRQPVPIQENTFEPSQDIKGEISIEQHTVDEFFPHINEENNVGNIDVMTVHTGRDTHVCTVCSRRFTNEFNLNRHNLLAHSADVSCHSAVCDKTFTDRTSSQGFMFCRKEGPQVFKEYGGALTQRERIVTDKGEEQFSCTECNRSFSRVRNLQTHMVNHTREKIIHLYSM